MTRKQVTVHYRRLEDVTNAFNGQTLEAAIRLAMARRKDGGLLSTNWKRRAWAIPPSNDSTLLINNFQDGDAFYFGDLTLYSPGFLQALISEVDDAPSLNVEQQRAPRGKEYVNSIMYWLVVGNHVLLIQSLSINTKSLEDYLTWLLKERTGVITNTGQALLQAKFDTSDIGGGDLDDIKEIIVGGTETRLTSQSAVTAREIETYAQVGEQRTWQEKAMDVLRALFNNEADVQQILSTIPTDASLQVSVHIGYKSTKRRASRAPMQQALRNLPDGEITAIGKSGTLTGRDIRLTYPASILMNESLIDPADACRALREAYTSFVTNGKIEP